MRHCDIRCDRKQYDSFEKEVDVYSKFYRKTPLDANFTKKDDSEILEGGEITKYRSIVGRLMYMAGERPDAQYAIQCLARHMAKPTKNALKNAWHARSYLFGTGGYGARLEERRKGHSMMDFREVEEVEDADKRLVEVVTDSDHAGNKNDRKSTTSMQVFIDGNLIDSKVRSQKAIALSSGESEFMALVAGCSEGMLVRHLWNKITGEECQMKARSDSSVARGMTQRQGIGRVRHIDASMQWIQQKEREKILTVAAIPTDLNSADIGAKNLPKKRLRGLQFMLHMVDAVGDRVGEQEFREIEEQHTMKQGVKKFGKNKDLRIGLLMLLATINKGGSTPTEAKEGEETSWVWMLLCTLSLACIGALSLIKWTTGYANEFLEGTKAFIRETTKAMTWVKGIDLSVKVKRVDQETQVSVPNARLERELEETAKELFLKDLYVEELEQELKKMKQNLKDFLLEREIAEKYSSKLERRFQRLSMTPSGRVLHFSTACSHFATAQPACVCHMCLHEGGVSESMQHN